MKFSVLQPRTTGRSRGQGERAFTLIEVMVTVSIIAVLLFVLLPAVNSVRRATKGVMCAANLKTVTAQFQLFADEAAAAGSVHGASRRSFKITDFLESLYGLDEYWDVPGQSRGTLTEDCPLMCPAEAVRLSKRKGYPCGQKALSPLDGVSIAANMRLFRAPVTLKGKTLLAPAAATWVSSRTFNNPYAPLVLDVDAKAALDMGVDPFYIAPPIEGVADPYSTGRYWSPGKRHGGKTMVGFVGGHVLGSDRPEEQRWDWSYHGESGP